MQLLCDHLDHILMHGLREFEEGYWPFVRYFTRSELVQRISRLRRVTTNIGKGREREGGEREREREREGGGGGEEEKERVRLHNSIEYGHKTRHTIPYSD